MSRLPRVSQRALRARHHTPVPGLWAAGALGCGCVATFATSASCNQQLRCEEDTKSSIEQKKNAVERFFAKSFDKIELPSLPSLPTLPTLSALSNKLSTFQATFNALHAELTRSPESVAVRVLADAKSVRSHPELAWDASVRLGDSLPPAERAFVRNRRDSMRKSFARLMEVNEDDVDERDIPVVAVAASGGGYRAMVNTLGAITGAKETGIWDCVTYAAGVSGSCWGLSVLYGIGEGNIDKTVEHIKKRITTPFLDPASLEVMTNEKTSEYLLSGGILKNASKGSDFSLVDLYGTLVSSRLFVSDSSALSQDNLKVSSQRRYCDSGENPLPIYCLIRHEVPDEAKVREAVKSHKDKEASELMGKSKWMWFEMSPYEFGCDTIGAWIPTWSVGRAFDQGKSIDKTPELGLTILSGIFASAFCATLFSYFKEVRPMLTTLPYFKPIESWLLANYETSLDAIHPFPPAELPNFLKNLDGKLNATTPETITKLDTLGFMDAGANLNVPYVPLFRRDCDLILAFDASADSQALWFTRAQQYATDRELHTWPRVESKSLFEEISETIDSDIASSKVDEAKAQERAEHPAHPPEGGEAQPTEVNPQRVPSGSAPSSVKAKKAEGAIPDGVAGGGRGEEVREPKLGPVNIWIGSTKDEDSTCRNDNPTVEEVSSRDGIALAYCPLVPGSELENPSEIWSTWKFEYTEEETQQLINLAKANFRAGESQIKTVLKGIWHRKRAQRLESEQKDVDTNTT